MTRPEIKSSTQAIEALGLAVGGEQLGGARLGLDPQLRVGLAIAAVGQQLVELVAREGGERRRRRPRRERRPVDAVEERVSLQLGEAAGARAEALVGLGLEEGVDEVGGVRDGRARPAQLERAADVRGDTLVRDDLVLLLPEPEVPGRTCEACSLPRSDRSVAPRWFALITAKSV